MRRRARPVLKKGAWSALVVTLLVGLMAPSISGREAASAAEPRDHDVVDLVQDDFLFGSYVIDRPGRYRLAEDISFNPNSARTLSNAIDEGLLPPATAARMGLPRPVDAYHASRPLPSQFLHGDDRGVPFSPGGPTDARYDPAAFGVGFFAAIVVAANDVEIDLGGHTIEQHAEHALLQRFFAVIELADQPFLPKQGPADFGGGIVSAERVRIHNGTIGRSAHHGIHGNANRQVIVEDIDFVGYEVAAVALNGVDGLDVRNVTATNRKDIPVLGTFSAARFIAPHIDELVRDGSATLLRVGGSELSAAQVRADLRRVINETHHDLIDSPAPTHVGRRIIDASAHPEAYALFHNPTGLVDGNSYSFLINRSGVAVDGFPVLRPENDAVKGASSDVNFENVHITDQRSDITEVVAIGIDGAAVVDPIGAVFQVFNNHPDTGRPLTRTHSDDRLARYRGNPVANAQALLAKAKANDDLGSSHLDVSRLNLPPDLMDWIEGAPGSETLAEANLDVICNGDSMFHVNKGAIGFKIDGVIGARLENTSVEGLVNVGRPGSKRCGNYRHGLSHPKANLPGYGGTEVRAYTFAGSSRVVVDGAKISDLRSTSGGVTGFGLLCGARQIRLSGLDVDIISTGSDRTVAAADNDPNRPPLSAIVRFGPIPAQPPGTS